MGKDESEGLGSEFFDERLRKVLNLSGAMASLLSNRRAIWNSKN